MRGTSLVLICRQLEKNIALDVSQESDRFLELSSQRYQMVVFGHFYCHRAHSLDLSENMGFLFDRLHLSEDPKLLTAEIAGGLFSLFILDRERQMCYVIGDRYGFKPVFYKKLGNEVHFTHHALNLASSSKISAESLDEFLSYGYLPFSGSLFEGVHLLRDGEVLEIALGDEPTIVSRRTVFHRYLPPEKRIDRIDEAVENLITVLDKFYSRFDEERLCLGLSGGYDSRLIAAYLAKFSPQALNFGNPRSKEVLIAERVARKLGLDLKHFTIPSDAIYQAKDRWASQMSPFLDLSFAHIAFLIKEVKEVKAEYYIDGFLGDTIIGSNYYYKLGSSLSGLAKNLLFINRYCSPIKDVESYCTVQSLTVEGLERMRTKRRELVLEQRDRCCTDEDMQESLLFMTRGKKLIAAGPNAVSSHAVCLCPYIDHAVYDIAMGISKELRAGNYLYNALWNKKFPLLADLPKNDTGASPNASAYGYRLIHAAHAIKRRTLDPLIRFLTGGRVDLREEYSSVEGYLSDPSTIRLLDQNLEAIIGEAARRLSISPEILRIKAQDKGEYLLRLLSLNGYLFPNND